MSQGSGESGTSEGRDPWAPPEDEVPPGRGASGAPSGPVPLEKRDQWAAPPTREQAGQTGQTGQAGQPTQPSPFAAPQGPPPQGPPPVGAAGQGEPVPPPPIGPEGPGQVPYGYPGYSSYPGYQGYQGHPGYQGHQGAGAPGPQGYPGYPGYPGYSGYPGHQGQGRPGYGWPARPMGPSNEMGVTALVLGIISAVGFCLWPLAIVLGILAIIFGSIGRGRAGRGEATNPGQALAGIICGAGGIVLGVGLLVALLVGA